MRSAVTLFYVALFASLLACGGGSTPDFAPDPDPVLSVKKTGLSSHILLSGTLRASDSSAVTAPADGWGLEIRWLAEDGSIVKEGDKVLEMDASEILSMLDSAESAYIKARSELAQAQNNASIGSADKKHLLRQATSALQKAQLSANVPADAYPRRVYEDMQLALKKAKSELLSAKESATSETKISTFAVKQARVAVVKTEREIVELQKKLEEYIISAPKDGIILRNKNWQEGRPYAEGDKTWPGEAILQMPSLAVMKVQAELSDVDDGRIHIGMTSRCTLDAYPERVFKGHVINISPVATAPDRNSLRRAFDVEIELEETDSATMRPGMSVQVEIEDTLAKDVLLAPRAGLLFQDDGVFALFPSGQTQSVEVGPCSIDDCVIKSGLTAGTKLGARSRR